MFRFFPQPCVNRSWLDKTMPDRRPDRATRDPNEPGFTKIMLTTAWLNHLNGPVSRLRFA
jgi:hypothetical protein